MAKKRRSPGGANRRTTGGRYTPPVARLPLPPLEPEDLVPLTTAAEDRLFEKAEQDLRRRCDRLLGSNPTTQYEWDEADLVGMDGLDATDEELIAYWRTFRRAGQIVATEWPDLAFVAAALRRGEDPAEAFAASWADPDGAG